MLGGVRAAGRQARSLDQVEHRPWPPPSTGWSLAQTWEDVLFAHWRVPSGELRPLVPAELEVEQHDGSAWLGIVAFRATAVRAHGALPLPGLSSFLELDVRTYVSGPDGKSGVWLLSLDASSRLATLAARRLYRLPSFRTRATLDRAAGWVDLECARVDAPGRVFSGHYRPAGSVFQAAPGSLDWLLTERYLLYATDQQGRLHRADLHHEPWPLQQAHAELELTSIAPFELRSAPLCHFVARQHVLVW
jgi:uncharacterized protein YqjF (DUF2071 family)